MSVKWGMGWSNVGKMKKAYRVGLRNRYGSMMQVIAGVHFNFSVPDSLWQYLAEKQNVEPTQDWISAQYFSLIRNYRRTCWLIPYLFGASPALFLLYWFGVGFGAVFPLVAARFLLVQNDHLEA